MCKKLQSLGIVPAVSTSAPEGWKEGGDVQLLQGSETAELAGDRASQLVLIDLTIRRWNELVDMRTFVLEFVGIRYIAKRYVQQCELGEVPDRSWDRALETIAIEVPMNPPSECQLYHTAGHRCASCTNVQADDAEAFIALNMRRRRCQYFKLDDEEHTHVCVWRAEASGARTWTPCQLCEHGSPSNHPLLSPHPAPPVA